MLKNYFKTAFRSLLRNRNYTIINISGLAAGISVCLTIFIIIQFERSFDQFHFKKDRIYRVLTEYHHADAPDIFYGKGVPRALPEGLKTSFKQIEKIAPILGSYDDQILVPGDDGISQKKFKEPKGVFYTTPSFFEIFDYPWLAGNAATALKDPGAAVITQETAEKYFGDWKKAMGKTIKLNNADIVKITGILQNVPANTDLQFKIVVSYGTGFTAVIMKSKEWNGTGSSFGCYILLPANVSMNTFNTELRAFVKKMKSPDNKDSHIIQPLGAIHFDTQTGDFSNKTMSNQLIRALWLISAFILLIACVNFINLSTAQAVNRAREVGVRKVLGSNRGQLRMQFLTETFIIVISAVILSVGITLLALPFMGRLLGNPLTLNLLNNPSIFLFLLAITVIVTFLAGFYPSIVLSGFNPINALKSKLATSGTRGFSLRKGLVVLQFVIAQALIIGTLILVKQMNYFTSQPLGFDKEAIVNIPFPGDSAGTSKLDYLRKELSGVNGIQRISFNSNTPVEDNNDSWSTFNYDHAPKETDFYTIFKFADQEYLPTYKLPLVAGRNIERSDTAKELLVNEKLLESLNVKKPEDALGKYVNVGDGFAKGPIVGVLKDFHDRSFRAPVAPLMICSFKRFYSQASLKVPTQDIPTVMGHIEQVWNTVYPDFVFEYEFLDAKVDSFYKQENKLSQIYKIFATIAIFLSCLGLYGLASFMAVQRIREVGIRKVLGASVGNIVYLFSREFMILITIAFVIASPIAWYFMNKWLQDYVYRIDISWWIFLLGGLAAIVIAMLSVSFQALKAAFANPVKSLRTE
jgi:putative ABC transport system permease protein